MCLTETSATRGLFFIYTFFFSATCPHYHLLRWRQLQVQGRSCALRKNSHFIFFFTIIYDLSDFSDSLFTPTKTNKQNIINIIVKRSLRLLVSSIPTHLHHQYDVVAAASTFLFTKSTTFEGKNCVKPDHRDHA